MKPIDYAESVAAYHFVCFWLISWFGLVAVAGIYSLLKKLIEWFKRS